MKKENVKNDDRIKREPGNHWLRVKVEYNGDVLLDNVIISNERYLGNYLFTDKELALYHQTCDNT